MGKVKLLWVKEMTEINFENRVVKLEERVREAENRIGIAEDSIQELRRILEVEIKPKKDTGFRCWLCGKDFDKDE